MLSLRARPALCVRLVRSPISWRILLAAIQAGGRYRYNRGDLLLHYHHGVLGVFALKAPYENGLCIMRLEESDQTNAVRQPAKDRPVIVDQVLEVRIFIKRVIRHHRVSSLLCSAQLVRGTYRYSNICPGVPHKTSSW